jgi:hypothetical protein
LCLANRKLSSGCNSGTGSGEAGRPVRAFQFRTDKYENLPAPPRAPWMRADSHGRPSRRHDVLEGNPAANRNRPPFESLPQRQSGWSFPKECGRIALRFPPHRISERRCRRTCSQIPYRNCEKEFECILSGVIEPLPRGSQTTSISFRARGSALKEPSGTECRTGQFLIRLGCAPHPFRLLAVAARFQIRPHVFRGCIGQRVVGQFQRVGQVDNRLITG